MQRVRAALAESRLVTVTGFGGVGKTRLALEAAREVGAGYPDGVWFIDLAGTRDGNVIGELVASALGLRNGSVGNPPPELAERCRNNTMLLVLDNCEHFKRDCAGFAAALLRTAPHVRILATSREPLGTAEEAVVGLLPFALPETANLCAREALRIPAVRLFSDRAHAAGAFELDDANVGTVIELCRQQTLRALIDWSFDLLAPHERGVFVRLGIFAGSFTLEAATAICGEDDAEESTLDTLDALVDKSLLVVETRRDDTHTFRMFASIRSYVRERLASEPQCPAIEARHRDYFMAVAAQAQQARPTADWLTALHPLEYCADDLRSVLEATLGTGRHAAAGAALAANLVDYWQRRGLTREGRAWLECALRCEDSSFTPALRVRVRTTLLDLRQNGRLRAPSGAVIAA